METIVITISDGCITDVMTSNRKQRVVIIDYDCDGSEEAILIPQHGGGSELANVEAYDSDMDMERCNELRDIVCDDEALDETTSILNVDRSELAKELLEELIRSAKPSDEVRQMIQSLIAEQRISPFSSQIENRTSVYIREAKGAKNGKTITASFYGISPQATLNLIIDHLNSQQ